MTALPFDDELRAVMFAHVRRLLDRHGGRIPSSELNAGVTVRGERAPIWNYQRGIYKPATFGSDGAALSVQTSADSPYADVHDPAAGHFIYKYQGTDPMHRDNVALRRAMERQRPLLYLVAVDQGVYDAVFPVYVAADDPGSLQFTLMADVAASSPGLGVDPLIEIRREYATRAVMQRLHQHQFRRAVLGAYRNRCAICQLKHLPLLDAAHIIPDHEAHGEPRVSNGLGLCKIHHTAYDVHILGIDPDARVHIRTDILDEIDGPMLRHGLQDMHRSILTLPRRIGQRPDRDFLAERFERFRAA